MNRNEKILFSIDQSGLGIEIGASHAPIVPKSDGFLVEIIDHLNESDLRKKYSGHNVDLSKIETVDHVWQGESYAELTGKRKHYDWIVASHVIEHTPDLIKFIKDCDEILKENGVLSLAIPDKSFCFDHYRPQSNLSQIIDHHLTKRTKHSPGCTAEYYLYAISKGGKIGWNEKESGETEFIHTSETAKKKMQSALSEDLYNDIHSWSFTPSSFRTILLDLRNLGLIQLQELSFFPTSGCEFYISLSRMGNGPNVTREQLLTRAIVENLRPTAT